MSMNDQDGYQFGGEAGQPAKLPGGEAPPGIYKFSEEELRLLNECNKESFYQRSLPIGTMFGFGTYTAVQGGRLKASPRFGAYPKVTLAVVVGYFIGKLSYQRTCADKLMALPNSFIGHLLREKRGGSVEPRRMQPAPPMLGAKPDEIYSDAGPGNSLDLDIDRPLFSDDSYRPTESEGDNALAPEKGKSSPFSSYEEMRRLNRGEYSAAKQDPYRVEPNTVPSVTRARASAEPRASPKTNNYGDVIE